MIKYAFISRPASNIVNVFKCKSFLIKLFVKMCICKNITEQFLISQILKIRRKKTTNTLLKKSFQNLNRKCFQCLPKGHLFNFWLNESRFTTKVNWKDGTVDERFVAARRFETSKRYFFASLVGFICCWAGSSFNGVTFFNWIWRFLWIFHSFWLKI